MTETIPPNSANVEPPLGRQFMARCGIGGVLMGLANLVPGISGGTMLLAVGVYPSFIQGVAEVCTFRFRLKTLTTLAVIVLAAIIAIVLLAGTMSYLVIHYRWVMYSLFIGLTLGGVPVVWSLVKSLDTSVAIAAVIGIAVMACIAFIDPAGSGNTTSSTPAYLILFVAGLAGGSAMILPGVSGGYLLLVLGQYLVILTAIDDGKGAASRGDWQTMMQTLHVIVPVGLGVIVGVVGVSNVINALLNRYPRPTLGFLLGLLLGAVLGLWPFVEPIQPIVGDIIKGVELTTESMVDAVEPKDWPTNAFAPQVLHIAGSLAMVVTGFLVCLGVSRLGRGKDRLKG